jgi:hypothetical protein
MKNEKYKQRNLPTGAFMLKKDLYLQQLISKNKSTKTIFNRTPQQKINSVILLENSKDKFFYIKKFTIFKEIPKLETVMNNIIDSRGIKNNIKNKEIKLNKLTTPLKRNYSKLIIPKQKPSAEEIKANIKSIKLDTIYKPTLETDLFRFIKNKISVINKHSRNSSSVTNYISTPLSNSNLKSIFKGGTILNENTIESSNTINFALTKDSSTQTPSHKKLMTFKENLQSKLKNVVLKNSIDKYDDMSKKKFLMKNKDIV